MGAGDTFADVTLHAQELEQLDGTTTRLYVASPSRPSMVPPSARTGWANSLTLGQLVKATNGRLPSVSAPRRRTDRCRSPTRR